MESVSLRVRLPPSAWQQFNRRAALREMAPGAYADMILRYALAQRTGAPASGRGSPLEEELVYFELNVPAVTKVRLAERSQRHQANVANFSGRMLLDFLGRFERDPREMAMVHYVSTRLEERSVLAHADLVTAIRLCPPAAGARLPPGYFARWIFDRLRPLVQAVERDGATVPLTVELLQEMMALTPGAVKE